MTIQRLPNPGGDDGNWGAILNGFLQVAHNADGSLLPSAITAAGAGSYSKPPNGIPAADLDSGVRASLGRATTALQTTSNLSDLASSSAARTNLGLGTAAIHNVGDFITAQSVALGSVNGVIVCDLSQGNTFTATLTGDVTISFVNWPSGEAEPILILKQDSSGGHAITLSGITWLPTGASPNNFATAAGATTLISVLSPDGGTTIYGDTGAQAGTSAGTFAAGNDSRITGALQAVNNLSDVPSASAARTNLGLGTAATAPAANFVDVSSVQTGIAGSKTFTSAMSVASVVTGAGLTVTDATNGGELRATTDSTHYFSFKKRPTGGSQIQTIEATGSASLYLDPIPSDGSSAADIRFFRNTNTTSSTAALYIFAADGTSTTQHYLSAKASGSYIGAQGGTFGFGKNVSYSTLDIGGSVGIKRAPIADINYTVLSADYVIAYTSLTASRTVTLPSAVGIGNRLYIIIDETGSANTNTIVVATTSSQTINGAATRTIASAYGSLKVYSNGANWIITP